MYIWARASVYVYNSVATVHITSKGFIPLARTLKNMLCVLIELEYEQGRKGHIQSGGGEEEWRKPIFLHSPTHV